MGAGEAAGAGVGPDVVAGVEDVYFDTLAFTLANPTVIVLSAVTDFTTMGLPVPSYTTFGGAGVGCALVGVCAATLIANIAAVAMQRMKRAY